MNRYTLIKSLLNEVEAFEETNLSPNLDEFTAWLQRRRGTSSLASGYDKDVDFTVVENQNRHKFPEVELATLLTSVFRFAKHYVKKALENTEIRTLEEFGFLAMLLERGEMSKSELIQQHLVELSSGTEISRRLLKNDFMQEFTDKADRRAKRVHITNKGREELIRAFANMHQASLVIKGNLEETEINQLNAMLEKLTKHHWKIHEVDKDSTIPLLVDKYVK